METALPESNEHHSIKVDQDALQTGHEALACPHQLVHQVEVVDAGLVPAPLARLLRNVTCQVILLPGVHQKSDRPAVALEPVVYWHRRQAH